MIKNVVKRVTVNGRSLRRGIFGGLFGGKKKEAQAPSIVVNREKAQQEEDQPFKKQVATKEEEMFIKKRDALLDTLAKQREQYDSELTRRRREIETASVASKREFEITVANLDYNRLIYDSARMDAPSDFKSPEELLSYLSSVLQKGVASSLHSTVLPRRR